MIINEESVRVAKDNFLSLDELAYLHDLLYNYKWNLNISPSSINKLIRMGLIENNNITILGEGIVADSTNSVEKQEVDKFEEFWKAYPKDDAFRGFDKTRVLRWNKAKTKEEYQIALNEITHEDLMKALNNEIIYRSSGSGNLFKWMKSSVNWLSQKEFYEHLEDEVENKNLYGKDIV